MSVGNRLREERLRLKASQASFASAAGVSKNTAINWEKDASSPTAAALIALAETGIDPLYVLTGRRSAYDPDAVGRSIQDDLAEIRRHMLEPDSDYAPGETSNETEERVVASATNRLNAMLQNDTAMMTKAQIDEASSLLDILASSVQLAAFRAADFVQNRRQRERIRESIAGWFNASDDANSPPPTGGGMNILATLALDYDVPVKLLVELVHELREDGAMLAASRT